MMTTWKKKCAGGPASGTSSGGGPLRLLLAKFGPAPVEPPPPYCKPLSRSLAHTHTRAGTQAHVHACATHVMRSASRECGSRSNVRSEVWNASPPTLSLTRRTRPWLMSRNAAFASWSAWRERGRQGRSAATALSLGGARRLRWPERQTPGGQWCAASCSWGPGRRAVGRQPRHATGEGRPPLREGRRKRISCGGALPASWGVPPGSQQRSVASTAPKREGLTPPPCPRRHACSR